MGNLTYSYDQRGARTQVGGSFARTNLPGAATSAVYDAANELTSWNGTTLSYDANGNMLGDGHNTFTWNARNQVARLNSVNLQYDAFGRRIKNAAGTSFLYDGANATQELSGSTVTANTLSGGIDELFQRSDSNGTVVPLTDALGSVIGLTNSSGTIITTYSYDPFGNTTTAGAASANPSQYTGRENEGNGLYFYRARYYSPVLGRFISEDPMGFAAGPNFYRYARNRPTNLIDRLGLCEDQPDKNRKALADCIQAQFDLELLSFTPTIGTGQNVPGNANGSATVLFNPGDTIDPPITATIINDILSKGLKDMPKSSETPYETPLNQSIIPGWTNGNDPFTNYTLNGIIGEAAVDSQIWELGNSLAIILNIMPKKLRDPTQDPGASLLKCFLKAVGRKDDLGFYGLTP